MCPVQFNVVIKNHGLRQAESLYCALSSFNRGDRNTTRKPKEHYMKSPPPAEDRQVSIHASEHLPLDLHLTFCTLGPQQNLILETGIGGVQISEN